MVSPIWFEIGQTDPMLTIQIRTQVTGVSILETKDFATRFEATAVEAKDPGLRDINWIAHERDLSLRCQLTQSKERETV